MSAKAENSETVRGRGRGGRRFVVPRPGATLSHLVKTVTALVLNMERKWF
jgi:hypothetical protein